MAVKYDIIFKDNRKLTKDAICFGGMAYGNWENSFNNREMAMRPANEQSMVQFHTANNIHPVWVEPDYTKFRRDWSNGGVSGQERRNANKAFLTELATLVDDLPVMQDVLTIHPLVGVVRAHIKNHPADKIITALMMVRNLCNYSDMAATYRHFRAAGYRPRFCIIMAHLVSKNFGAMGRHDWVGQGIGEYNWINPNHFGKAAFLRLMGHTSETQFDFIQRPWSEQRGYRRDNFYRDTSRTDFDATRGGLLIFDERMKYGSHWDWNNERVVDERSVNDERNGYINVLKTRNIVDWGSVAGDEPICPTHTWNCVHGFSVVRGPQTDLTNIQKVDLFVQAAEALCEAEGISIRS